MEKTSFVLHTRYSEQVDMLTDIQAGMLFRTIMTYAAAGEVKPPEDPMVAVLFSVIRQQMDNDSKKYEETCKKRQEAGKKGGRPRKSAEIDDSPLGETDKKPIVFFANLTEPKKADNDNEYDYEDEYENDYENDCNSISGDGGEEEGDTARAYVCFGENQYLSTKANIKKFTALAQELFLRYGKKQPSVYDLETVFDYVYTRTELDDGTAIAAYDTTKAELLRYTFELAAQNDKVNWKYINGIYSNYGKRNIQTVDDAMQFDWQYRHGDYSVSL